jgi:orotate phosphoribosyltransferase
MTPAPALPDRDRLLSLIGDLAVVHGKVTLSSGQETDWYIDMRRLTLHHEGAPLVGRVMRQLTADLRYDVVGGLTLGADPVATAMLHAASDGEGFLDACVVRKADKAHGLQRRVEGPDVAGRSVLVVDDVSTTGGSPLTAAAALQEAGAEVLAIAVIVDRGGRAAVEKAGFEYRAAFTQADLGLD